MKRIEKKRRRGLMKPIACLAIALSAMLSQHASATTGANPYDEYKPLIWCNGNSGGNVDAYAAIPGFPSTIAPDGAIDGVDVRNPPDTWDEWNVNRNLVNKWPDDWTWFQEYTASDADFKAHVTPLKGFGGTAETLFPAEGMTDDLDRYAIQLNYWNSLAEGTQPNAGGPYGHSPGQSCIKFWNRAGLGLLGRFVITYPAAAPQANDAELAFARANPNSYPWFGFAPYQGGPTTGGPTGYPSTFKGCSWDDNSCTRGSAVPNGKPTEGTDDNVFPAQLKNISMIPTVWSISEVGGVGTDGKTYGFGMPLSTKDNTLHVFDAAYDIWFDKDAQTATGQAPYGKVRGQNDGLEIMVWMNSNGSYVDTGSVGNLPAENQPGYAQPAGHIRERAMINGVLYDVWVGRLNNPYFAYSKTQDPNAQKIDPTATPDTCPRLKESPAATCGVSWNVVSFVATKDINGTDQRKTNMNVDAKLFADYILGTGVAPYSTVDGNTRSGGVLQCPKSVLINQATLQWSDPTQTAPCLDPNWYLMSVQAGFETWIGGNGLQSDNFQVHVERNPAAYQTSLQNANGISLVNWNSPLTVTYNKCSSPSPTTHVTASITGKDDNGNWITVPSSPLDLGPPNKFGVFSTTLSNSLQPMVGDATIHFVSVCGNVDTPIHVDPTGKVFYSDGKTPVYGAKMTLLYSTSGTAFGPFASVPNANYQLANPILNSNGNQANPVLSTAIGSYGWSLVPGWYRVKAEMPGCAAVTTAAKQVTSTKGLENVNITLSCAAPKPVAPPPPPPPSGTPGVTVKLTVNGADWQNGYCRNIVLTNTNNYPVTWKAVFNLPYPGNVTQSWNITYTKSGNTITATGAGWDNVLQPKQTLNSLGFCATK